MRKIRERVEEGLHPIENEKRPRVIRKKRGGIRLKSKHHRRIVKTLASFSVAAVLCMGVFGVNALFFRDSSPNVVDEGFVTVSYKLPEDGSTPDMHSGLENIGYMNTRLMGQASYYSEMEGSVDTMIKQNVSTFKQYSDGVLIQTDITTSSMVNSARQFCYVGDRVIWRDAAGGPSSYNGIDTVWKDGEPYANMMVSDYKAKNGLPGTSFSVYVINEDTLMSADPVVVNGDGTYTQTYYLDPATDKAPAYYVNQMMFNGGLTALPTFEYITVTYTFDESWQVLSSVIDEAYTATMGVSVRCVADYTTIYEYGTERAVSDAYDTYYKNYADKPATGAPTGGTVTAAACLSNAFAPVLNGPVTFALDLDVNGTAVSGLVYVDASDMSALALRAQIGNIFVQYAGEEIFLRYGEGVKGKAETQALLGLLERFLPSDGEGVSLDKDALLEQLGGGVFAVAEDGRSATLDSELSLMGLTLPIHFDFVIGEDGSVSLGKISADLSLGGVELGLGLRYSDREVAEITDADSYPDLVPYVESVLDLLGSDVLSVNIGYEGDGFSVQGTVALNIADPNTFSANGTLTLIVGQAGKKINFAYADGVVYLDLDGVKVKARADEAVALIMQMLGTEEISLGGFDLASVLSSVLSDEFAKNISLSEKEGALEVALAANELMNALGIDLGGIALGNVTLGITDGAIYADVLGADVSVSRGEAFTVDTEGYTDLMPLVNAVVSLFGEKGVTATVAYAAGGISVDGALDISLAPFAVKGNVVLTYTDAKGSASKALTFAYGADEFLYLTLDGAKLKLNVTDAAALITSMTGANNGAAVQSLLEKLFSLTWGDVIAFDSETSVIVAGTELLEKLGVDFALGDVSLSVAEDAVTVDALGARIVLTKGERFALDASSYTGYSDVTGVLETLAAAIGDRAIALGGTINLTYKDTKIALEIKDGAVNWADGFRLSLDLIATVGDTTQKISLYADDVRVKLVYGNVGVDLVYADLYTVGEAFEGVYARIAAILNASMNGVSLPGTAEDLFAQAQTGAALSELLASIDLPQIIRDITFGAPNKGGFMSIAYKSLLRGELFATDGVLGCVISKASMGDITFSASLNVGRGGAVAEPEGDYMTAGDFAELLDFVGASVATLASDDVRMQFNDLRTIDTATGAMKFDISGELAYHGGTAENGEPFVRLDTAAKTITVNPAAYVYFKIWLDEKAAEGTDLFLEFWMYDYGEDGELDFFVSLSKYMPYLDAAGNPTLENTGTVNPAYKPLNFAVSASDVLTILASGVSLVEGTFTQFFSTLGFPETVTSVLFDTIDDYFVSKWLTAEEQGQLGTLGGMLAETLGLNQIIEGLLSDVTDAVTGDLLSENISFDYCLTKLGISKNENGETEFAVSLNSDLIFGGSGLNDLSIVIRKMGEINNSYLTGISIGNIYANGNGERTDVGLTIARGPLTLIRSDSGVTLSSAEDTVASLAYGGYGNYIFAGVDELIKSLALSATHKTESGEYALNDHFYISGSATISLLGLYNVNVNVNGISVKIGEDGDVAVDASLTYPKVMPIGSLFPVIEKGGTTELTIKNGVVYMRRTLDGNAPEHRVMPMEAFADTILDQVAFILNLSSKIQDLMKNGETSTVASAGDDYGVVLSDILSKYTFTAGAEGNSWGLTLNGNALTGGVLDDMVVTLSSDEYNGIKNVMRTLQFSTSMYGDLISANATLTFNNPCGVSDGTQEVTKDISAQIPDLYDVTLIAPESLGGKWAKNEDGTYSITVQMFLGTQIEFVYGDNSYVFTVGSGDNVFRLADVPGLPDSMLWEQGAFEYTAESGRIEIALAPDTVVYNSTVAFGMDGAENVNSTSASYDKQISLGTPVAEGYTFLGWFTKDADGKLVKVTELSYAGGGKTVSVEAMWASDLVFDKVETKDTQRDWVVWHRTFSVDVAISGGALHGAYADTEGITMYTKYTFTLKGDAYSDDIGYAEQSGFLTTASCSKDGNSAANRKYVIDVELTFSYLDAAIGSVTANTSKGF